MIALSSFRPFTDKEYAWTQGMAAGTWLEKFEQVYYFGDHEDNLFSHKTQFLPCSGHPTVKQMAKTASEFVTEYVAILNADIHLGKRFTEVQDRLCEMSLPAATSYRFDFDPLDSQYVQHATRNREDRGMDIFIANPAIWKMVANAIPENLWFGHPTWDSWVCGFFCYHLGFGFRHFTEFRCVFHPKHGGRTTPNSPRITADSPYFTRAKRPSPL